MVVIVGQVLPFDVALIARLLQIGGFFVVGLFFE